MKFAIRITLSFSALVLLGFVLLGAVDSFLLGHVDPKLDPDQVSAFQTGVSLGILLIIGAIGPIFIAAAAAQKLIDRSPRIFVLVASAVTLILFAKKAFLPVSDWLEPFMPRSLVYPLVVASVLGACGVAVAMAWLFLVRSLEPSSQS